MKKNMKLYNRYPSGTRTQDPIIKSDVLLPTELRGKNVS